MNNNQILPYTSNPITKYLNLVDDDMTQLYREWKDRLSPYPYITWGADGEVALHVNEQEKLEYQQIGDKFIPLLSIGKVIGHSYMYLSFVVGLSDWKAKLLTHLTNLRACNDELPGILVYLQQLIDDREGDVITPFAVSPHTIIGRAEKCLNLVISLIASCLANNSYTLETYQKWNEKYQYLYNEFSYWIFFIIEGKIHLVLTKYLNYLLDRGYHLEEVSFVGSSTVPSAPSGQPAPRGTGDHNDMVPHLKAFGINIATRYFTVENATTDAISPIKDQKVSDLFASRTWPTKKIQEASNGIYDAVTNPESTLAQFPTTIPFIEADNYYNADGSGPKLHKITKRVVNNTDPVKKCPFRKG